MFFIRLRLMLKLVNKSTGLRVSDATYAHAAIMYAFCKQQHEIGSFLHDMQRHKPLTLYLQDESIFLSFFGENSLDYVQILTTSLQHTPTLQIGTKQYEVISVDVGNDGVSNWINICQPTLHTQLHFTFLTPTAVTRQDESGKRYTVLHPTPHVIFNNLISRWHSLNGESLPSKLSNYLTNGGCVIEQYKLETTQFSVGERRQKGFCGRITYLCRQDNTDCISALNKLTRIAPFVGIGYQTARGMGAVTTQLSG